MHNKSPLTPILLAALLSTIFLDVQAQGIHSLTVDYGDGNEATFTLEDLDQLEQTSYSTGTIWTEGVNDFSGVTLKAFLDAGGVEAEHVELIALNDYSVNFPLDQVDDEVPLLATRMNGNVMSVRDKGPFWLIFPYDSDPKYQTEVVYSYSIWQLSRVAVIE